jgi:transcriptional regulator with XRE-family HTH domain
MATYGDARWLTELRERIAGQMKANGISQVALAEHLGITPKHMNQFLQGTVRAGSPLLLERMAEAVGLRITIADSGEPPPPLRSLRQRRAQVKALTGLAAANEEDMAYVLAGIGDGTRERLRAALGGTGGMPAVAEGPGTQGVPGR